MNTKQIEDIIKKRIESYFENWTNKTVPRAKVEELPADCRGCGRCCKAVPKIAMTDEQYTDYLKYGRENEEMRGMSVKPIRHNNGKIQYWYCNPPCPHLNEKNECKIYAVRPKSCVNDSRGGDVCQYMFYVHKQ